MTSLYQKNTQNRAKKPVRIFHIRQWPGYPVCTCLRALAHRQMRWRTGRFESGHIGLGSAHPQINVDE